jgi:hypothetical protein
VQRLKVGQLGGADEGIIPIICVRRRELKRGLREMLATVSLDQPIERVVSVIADGIDPLAAVEHDLQRDVFDPCNVTHGIVGVVQVLYRRRCLENLTGDVRAAY